MSGAYIYILGSHTGTLYIGVTSNLYLRVMQHKEGTWEGFTSTYGCKRLLYLKVRDIRTPGKNHGGARIRSKFCCRLQWLKSSEQHG